VISIETRLAGIGADGGNELARPIAEQIIMHRRKKVQEKKDL
jgi:hypothetical protein